MLEDLEKCWSIKETAGTFGAWGHLEHLGGAGEFGEVLEAVGRCWSTEVRIGQLWACRALAGAEAWDGMLGCVDVTRRARGCCSWATGMLLTVRAPREGSGQAAGGADTQTAEDGHKHHSLLSQPCAAAPASV